MHSGSKFSIMLLQDLLEEQNRKMKIKHKPKSVYFKLRQRFISQIGESLDYNQV